MRLCPLLIPPLLAACTSHPGPAAETAAPPAAPATRAAKPPSLPPDAPLSAEDRGYNDTLRQLSALLRRPFPRQRVKDFKSGDLDADGRRDVVVVLEAPCDPATRERNRTVLLLLRDRTAQLRVAARNCWFLVYPIECAGYGEQYGHLDVGGGRVTFHSYQPGVDYDVTFRYEPASRDWWLYRRVRTEQPNNEEPYHGLIVTRETPHHFGRIRFSDYTGGEF